MEDKATDAQGVPGWFRAAAALALLFELVGCFLYLAQVGVDRATLPLDQRATWDATPTWMIAANAIAVWFGLAGAALLLARRRLAVPLLLASLVAVAAWGSGYVVVPQLRQTVPDTALLVPILVFVGCYAIFQLARLAGRRGWLR